MVGPKKVGVGNVVGVEVGGSGVSVGGTGVEVAWTMTRVLVRTGVDVGSVATTFRADPADSTSGSGVIVGSTVGVGVGTCVATLVGVGVTVSITMPATTGDGGDSVETTDHTPAPPAINPNTMASARPRRRFRRTGSIRVTPSAARRRDGGTCTPR